MKLRYYGNYISILTLCFVVVFISTGCSLTDKNQEENNKEKDGKLYSLNMPIELGNKWEYGVGVSLGDEEKNNFIEEHEIIDIDRASNSSKIFWTLSEKVQNKEVTTKKYYGMNWNQTEFYLNKITRELIDLPLNFELESQDISKGTVTERYTPGVLIAMLEKEETQDINVRLKEEVTPEESNKNSQSKTKYYNILGKTEIFQNQTIETSTEEFKDCVKAIANYKKVEEKTNLSTNISEIYWICPRVGIVKYVYTRSGDSESTVIKELNNYDLK